MRLTDVHRSGRRWVSYVLGEEWIVRLEQRHTSEDDLSRDLAFVELGGPAQTLFARSGYAPQGDVRRQVLVSVTLLPTGGETPQESSLRASELAEGLQRAAEAGLLNAETDELICAPMTLPLWDFKGIPVTGPGRAGPDEVAGTADIADLSVRPIPDPQDDKLYTVSMVMRITWWTGGAIGPGGPLAVGGLVPSGGPR